MIALFTERARLLAILAGLAWVLGLMPSAPVRLLVVVLVVVGAVLDVLPERLPAAVRVTTLRGRGR
ncbi:hypothetical protein POF50_004565 [Streptomyces sp. SL13]|uniref:Uncharacterized protein n=1 Tax=Streptantibioticus silvisoli TaxID=2705255 RepID=A0AA90KF83_9ACTN|nr:hypothetical protein [Streptantibioticus silvisoli]MDI5968624.1 hypothetical protein [Streptantibioticus silvisoli]